MWGINMRSLLFLLGMGSSLMPKTSDACNNKCSKEPLIIAHRGASGYEPENTLRAFNLALQMGAPVIELDVFCCKSGQVVVIHDETVDRTTNGTGAVADLTWDQLKMFDAGKGEHIPLLSQVLDLVNKRAVINIEIKDVRAAKPVAELIQEYVQKGWSYDHFLISSFDHAILHDIHNYCHQIKTGALFDEGAKNLLTLTRTAQSVYVIVDYHDVTEQLITQAHANGLQVYTYTVNDYSIAIQLKKWGIDGVITNYPDIMQNSSL